jgi:hypothetical protein
MEIIQNVRRAAQGGYWNSRITNQLETFVASQESNARLLCSNAISAREILVLCVLDLALTMNQGHQPSTNLLDVAIKYLKLSCKLESTRHFNHFEDIYKLIHESNLRKSVPSVLCDAKILLNIQQWREKSNFWQKLAQKMDQFQESQSQLDKIKNIDMQELFTLNGQKIFEDIIVLCKNTENYLYKLLAHLKILHSIIPNGN